MTEPVSPDAIDFPSRGKNSKHRRLCGALAAVYIAANERCARAPDDNNLRRTTAPKGEPDETRLRAANHDL
jgi:hypothetical protein